MAHVPTIEGIEQIAKTDDDGRRRTGSGGGSAMYRHGFVSVRHIILADGSETMLYSAQNEGSRMQLIDRDQAVRVMALLQSKHDEWKPTP